VSVVHRYEPFPKPESTTTHDEMVAKLAVRVGVPSAKPDEPLKWVKGNDQWTILSRCGTYKIRKRCVEGRGMHNEPQFSYEAFRVVKNHWDFSLGLRGDPAEARKLCQENREAHP
jgi:hypothetical protein